jgi:curli biogenesis system outer membrane secretion channel CsgG
MMKKLIAILMAIALCACLFGCAAEAQISKEGEIEQESNTSMFIEVERVIDNWRVVYHKDTKVMYAVSSGSYNRGTFTVMLNPDGTPMIWEDE